MAIGDLNVRIGATIKGLQDGLKSAQKALKKFSREANQAGNDLSTSVSLPILAIGGAALQAAGDLEALQLALESTFKNAGRTVEESRTELEALRKSAKAPGLDFEQAVRASIRLQNVGFAAEDARKAIEELANAAALSGGTAENLSSVTVQLSQLLGKSKIEAQDIKIILDNIPALASVFKEKFGGSTAEQIRDSGVTAREFVDITVQGLSELDRVQGGLANSFVNFKSEVKNALATVGLELNRVFDIQGLVDGFANKIAGLADKFRALSPEMQRTIGIIALIVASIGPAIKAVGLAGSALTALSGPVGLTIAALAALAAAFVYAYENSAQFRAGVSGATEAVKEFWNILFTNIKTFADAVRQTFVEFSPGNLVKKLLTSLNPVGQALAAGKEIGKAFSDGFAEKIDKEFRANLSTVKKNLAEAFPNTNFFPGTDNIPSTLKAAVGTPGAGKSKGAAKTPLSDAAREINKVFTDLQNQLRAIDVTTATLGGAAEEALGQKSDLITSAIENLIEKGVNPANAKLQELINKLKELRGEAPAALSLLPTLATATSVQSQDLNPLGGDPEGIRSQVEGLNEAMSRTGEIMTSNQEKAANLRVAFADLSAGITSVLQGAIQDLAIVLGETLGNILSGVADGGQILGSVFSTLAGYLKQLGEVAIKTGAAFFAIQTAFKNPLSAGAAIGLIAAGVGLIALSSLIKNSIPALADGGIVNRPTLALIGEAGPEAVVPLRNFKGIGGDNNFVFESRISGNDLLTILRREGSYQNRIR